MIIISTISDSLWFSYNGQKSSDYNIVNVQIDSGMMEENFLSNRDVYEQEIRGRDKNYYYGIRRKNLVIPITFAFLDYFDPDKLRAVKRWLVSSDYYQPLYFSNDVNRIYYALVTSNAKLIHNGLSQGYVELTFQTNSPFAYSNVYTTNDVTSTTTNSVDISNYGDLPIYPEIFISKPLDADVANIIITNGTNSKYFSIANVNPGEEIYINSENKYIETNFSNLVRYDDFEGTFWPLEYGVNTILIDGNCTVSFRYQCRFL